MAKAGFVDGIRGRLGKSDEFHGISTVIDGRKWWHTLLPGRSGKSASRYLVPIQIFLTKLLKNEVPAQDVAASGGPRRWRCWNPRNIDSTRQIVLGLHKRWLPRTSRPCLRLHPRGKSARRKPSAGKAQSLIASIAQALFFNSTSTGFAECAAF